MSLLFRLTNTLTRTRVSTFSTSSFSTSFPTLSPLKLQAIVRAPPTNFASGLLTHLSAPTAPADYDVAITQWVSYCMALEKHGYELHQLASIEEPDSVFIEDPIVMFRTSSGTNGNVAVVCRNMGSPIRRKEVESVEAFVVKMKERGELVDRVEFIDGGEDVTLDGGDVLKCPATKTVYVGLTLRTSQGGVDLLQKILKPEGYTVIGVPTTKVLHLKSCVTALPCGTIIGFDELVDDVKVYPKYMSVPEEAGAHCVILKGPEGESKGTLLMAASAPKTAAILTEMGYVIESVDIGEFEKFEGCVTCLSVRIRNE